MTKAEIVAQISRQSGIEKTVVMTVKSLRELRDFSTGIIHGKCKRVDGCGKRGVLARLRQLCYKTES